MRRSRRRIVGQTAGVVVRRLAPLAVAVAVTSAASGLAACSSAESDGPPDVHFLAQCLNLSDTPMPPSVVCRVDGEGNVESTTSIELTSGQPFVTGPDNSHVAAVDAGGNIVDLMADEPVVLAAARPDAVYGFDRDGDLVELRENGELHAGAGGLLATFAIDGNVDLRSGIDIAGTSHAFTVALDGGGFAVVIGDMTTGTVREVLRSDRYIGQARWSPGGTWLALVGPDFRSVQVLDAGDGHLVREITSTDPRLSGRFNSPSWIDAQTIAVLDAVPALVEVDRDTGHITVVRVYAPDAAAVPALPVAVSQPPT